MACIDEWINEIPQLVRCRECSCDSTRTSPHLHCRLWSLSAGQERDRATHVSFPCHLASPGENTREIHGHPVCGPVPTCGKAGRTKLWQTVKISFGIRPLEVWHWGERTLVCLWNDALKFQWPTHFFKCPKRYILRWIRWDKFVLPLIRRPLISSAQFYLLSSKASAC